MRSVGSKSVLVIGASERGGIGRVESRASKDWQRMQTGAVGRLSRWELGNGACARRDEDEDDGFLCRPC